MDKLLVLLSIIFRTFIKIFWHFSKADLEPGQATCGQKNVPVALRLNWQPMAWPGLALALLSNNDKSNFTGIVNNMPSSSLVENYSGIFHLVSISILKCLLF